jgi:ketosteroid isomerase-like protein
MFNILKPRYWYITTILLALAVGCFSPQQSKNSSLSETPALTPASLASSIPSSDLIKKAEQLFNSWVALEWNFDQAVFDLYAEDALIQNTRQYPDGKTRVLRFSSQEWKTLGLKAMPLARSVGDRNKYSQVTYTVEGDRVRISTQRYSLRKQYSSPRSLLVGPTQTGEWRIFEDISFSQP